MAKLYPQCHSAGNSYKNGVGTVLETGYSLNSNFLSQKLPRTVDTKTTISQYPRLFTKQSPYFSNPPQIIHNVGPNPNPGQGLKLL